MMNLDGQRLFCGVIFLFCLSAHDRVMAQKNESPPPGKTAVQVFLTATRKDGSPGMLVQSELSVFVGKQPAQVNTLRSAKNDPLLFALLVDVSKSDAASAGLIRKAALQLFQGLATGGNQGYLVLFSDIVAISGGPLQISQVEKALDGAKFDGGTAIYNAIEQTCTQKLSRSGNPDTPRRAILLISDGEDNSSNIPHANAVSAAENEGIAVFSLVPGSASPGPRAEQFLKEVSRNTGGRVIFSKNLAEGVAPLLTAIEEQWALSFVAFKSPDQKLHSLAVKSSQKDLQVSAPTHILLP
jgi:Ca-activated chloride channel homolog